MLSAGIEVGDHREVVRRRPLALVLEVPGEDAIPIDPDRRVDQHEVDAHLVLVSRQDMELVPGAVRPNRRSLRNELGIAQANRRRCECLKRRRVRLGISGVSLEKVFRYSGEDWETRLRRSAQREPERDRRPSSARFHRAAS